MFVAFNTALTVLLSNFIMLTETITELNKVIPLYRNIQPIFKETSEYDASKENIGEITGDIEVSHISFRYSKDTPLVLKDVSLHIKQGEHIALVGTSGSGKSTLLRILLGFENAESGQIYFSGKDISQYDIRSLRKQLGVVLQTGQLISGSIFENVVGSSTTLTITDVENALEKAGILDEIQAMPMGIQTVISEDFGTISGGQKQRILIARALVSNPRVLFFDEATSALDNRTQKIVSNSINELNITRITIAHRLSTITDCDRIIVLDNGRIAEEGSYEELINKKGIFYNMSQRQIV
jgi:ATP-binding cassette subfamily C protein